MKNTALTLFTFIVLITQSQNNRLDSLQNILKTVKADTNRVNALLNLSEEYLNLNSYELSSLYAGKAQQLSKKINDSKGQVSALNITGNAFYNKAEYKVALACFDSALKICAQQNSLKQLQYKTTFNIANTYFALGYLQLAANNYAKAQTYFKQNNQVYDLAKCYSCIGNVYTAHLNKNKEALANYKESIKLYTQLNNKSQVAEAYVNTGSVNTSITAYKQAAESFNHALEIYRSIGDSLGAGIVYLNFGDLFLKQHLYQDARNYFNAANILFTNLMNVYLEAEAQSGIFRSLVALEKYEEALGYGEKALKNAIESNNKECIILLNEKLSKNEEKLNHPKKALEYLKTYIWLHDSVINLKTSQRIEQYEILSQLKNEETALKLKQEEQEVVLETQHKINELELSQTRLITWFAGIVLVLLVIIIYLVLKAEVKKKK